MTPFTAIATGVAAAWAATSQVALRITSRAAPAGGPPALSDAESGASALMGRAPESLRTLLRNLRFRSPRA
jgi:hypothetical protein